MRLSVNFVAALATAATFAAVASAPARAECKRYGFSVNDYGKDGPTKDAKSLLDKLIATKMSEKGVKDYKTGKKSVRCEMFLNFIVFDEYTCTAEATACWGGTSLPKSEQASAADDGEKEKAAAAEPPKDKKKEAALEMSSAAEKAVKATTNTEKSAKASAKTAHESSKEKAEAKAEAKKDAVAKEVAEKKIPDPKDALSVTATAKADDPAAETREAMHDDAKAEGGASEATTATATANASSSDKTAPATASDSKTPSTAAASTAESKSPATVAKGAGEAKPVETGSLAEPAKKPAAKHNEEKKPASKSVRHLAPGPGYPVPMPPPDDLGQ